MTKAPIRQDKNRLAREHVLDAAERLLRAGPGAAFSMRDLAAEAGVSFATPFNQFGSKAAIAQALSARRINEMTDRFKAAKPTGDAVDRALAAVDIAVGVIVEEPAMNRAMIGSLGAWSEHAGAVNTHSSAFWSTALGDYAGIAPALASLARMHLPDQLAVGFRGCLSFWVAGEIADGALSARAKAAAIIALACLSEPLRRDALLAQLGR